MNYKMIVTDTHVFFLTGPYSNWHITPFEGRLEKNGDIYQFNCTEQYLMASKAHLFGDQDSLTKIMAANHPRDQKALGRTVDGFDKQRWDENARDIMFRACWYKLSNDEYNAMMSKHSDKHLVEGNPNDPIWAVGLAWDDPAILDPTNRKGTNWLGEAHMEVRQYHVQLIKAAVDASNQNQIARINIWTKQINIA